MPRSTAEELTAFGGDGLPHGRRSGFFCCFLPGANGWTDPLSGILVARSSISRRGRRRRDAMRYGSVCSGIEAASVAWRPLGWKCAFVSEIEKFPAAVLAERFPEVPNLGDFTKIERGNYDGDIDLLVGG